MIKGTKITSMMKKFILSIFIFFIIVSFSCDRMASPFIINGYKEEITIHIYNHDGLQAKAVLPPDICRVSRKKGIIITGIEIFSKDNKLMVSYSSDFINNLRKSNPTNFELWVATEKGLYLIPRKYSFDSHWKEYVAAQPVNKPN